MPDPFIAVALIAAELGQPVDTLAARLGAAVIHDNVGVRVISRETAAAFIAQHRAAQQAARDQAAACRAELAAKHRAETAAKRARLRALAHREISGSSAYADMVTGDQR